MSGHRSEEPTARRRREARRRGDVPASAELSGAAALAGGLAGLAFAGPGIARALAEALRGAASAGALAVPPEPGAVLTDATVLVARLTLVPGASALACAALVGGLQTGFLFSSDALRPRLERLDPMRGLRRLCSVTQLGRVALALTKGAVLAGLLALWWHQTARTLASLPRTGAAAPAAALPLLRPLALQLAAAFGVLGLLDLGLARRRNRRQLMMTRHEVRRDLREDEGDPAHRVERRRIHRAILEAGSIARATVVVVNPTRVAVALRHARGEDGAPRVIAKGTGLAAARIRSAARRAGVPIVRDVPLARALHRLAEIGDEIPEELYHAAAALLAHLYGAGEHASP